MRRFIMLSLRLIAIMVVAGATCYADNPIIQTKYTADPAPMVYKDTVYLYTTHDEDDAQGFKMFNWMLYTSTDMVNWTDHGIIGGVREPYKTFSWADGNNAWAPQCLERNGKFYLYCPFPYKGRMAIGVAVSDSPSGPFTDPIGKPLISGNSTGDYDPTAYIDDDGQAYLYWGGNGPCFYVKLNEDMVSISGSIQVASIDFTGTPPKASYTEGPWFWKKNNHYYLAWASRCCPEGIGYAMSDSPTGPWKCKGTIMDPNSHSDGNHPGIADYKGTSYLFGLDYELFFSLQGSRKKRERRSVCVATMTYNADGTIKKVSWWGDGAPIPSVPQVGHLNPYDTTQAETICWASGVKTEPCSKGGIDVCDIDNGDFIKVKGVDFGDAGAATFTASVASDSAGGVIELHFDGVDGKLIGSVSVPDTGGWQDWKTVTATVSGAAGIHDLYLVFKGNPAGHLFNFDYWKFEKKSNAHDLVAIAAAAAPVGDSPREHLSLDANWKFHLGDDWPDAMHLENSGTGSGPAAERFADSYWRVVNLPHDWAVELPFDQSADGGHGFKALGGKYPTNSIAWYRRAFGLPAADSGKHVWLTFDGAFRDATVWVNGWLVKHHEGGYYPFREDITDVLHFGGTNTISVRVDATKFEGWFYEGAGIYRHVWLDKTAPVAIALDGIFVYSSFKNNVPSDEAEIHVEANLLNTLTNAAKATVKCEIISPDGKLLKQISGSENLKRKSQGAVKLESKLSVPVLWSPESPKLYKLVTTVSVADKIVDQKETTFGIRTVGFDPTNGFLLNGKHCEIYGTCNHQDHAGVGAAIPDALQEFRVKKLKEFGCNAIRTSHNPPTPELLDACDRLGMLVLDESRLMGSDSENMKKWDDQIRRDRNHPSVAIWCIANEQFMVQDTPQAANVALSMQDYVKQLDPLRPVTYAAAEDDVFRGINSVIEVRGWNYHYGSKMDKYHAEHPNQPNVGTEQASVVGTRGIYTNDRPHGYVAAYDVVWPGWTTTAESWWSFFAVRPWLSGAFVWTGFDYRGEPTPYWWPCINSHFGILDTCGFPKDAFYYYQSWWTTNTVLHLLPHWNWPGREGQEILVQAFSNCKQVELFLNGASLGKQAMKPNSKLSWQVKYAPGTLSAKGFDAAGNVIAETKMETTGDAAQIQLTPDRKTINADGEDVSVFTVSALDAQGRVVPVAQNKINFAIEGAGKIIGVGNGDPSCHEPDTFISTAPERNVAVDNWRWQLAKIPKNNRTVPEYANDFDDSAWTQLSAKTSSGELTIKNPDTTAIYRAHFSLTEEDLKGAGAQICFGGCDDEGWYFVNGQFVGESHDWQAQPIFDIKKFLHAGDNVIAVGVNNGTGQGGLNPNVTVKIIGHAGVPPWSRSLFNGLAQVIVQSTKDEGEIKLTATADNLTPATAAVQTQP